MRYRELLWPENLLSLSRVVLAPLAWIFLSRPGLGMLAAASSTIILAGITDGLDGMVARRRKVPGTIGVWIDPLADKIFAGVTVLALIATRDFPIWVAVVIVGRDLLILFASILLLGKAHGPLHSNLSGKYAFASVIVLLGSYIIRFPFGQTLLLYTTLVLITMSLVNYTRVFWTVKVGAAPPVFADSDAWRLVRKLAIIVVAAIYFFAFYLNFSEWREQWRAVELLGTPSSINSQAVENAGTIDHVHVFE